MKLKVWSTLAGLLSVVLAMPLPAQELRHVRQEISGGTIEGVISADGKVRTFKGVPFARPPVGALRWQPPQPVKPWSGVRPAIEFGPRPMQGRIYDDMVFHDAGPSEDCLYLNLWIPEEQPEGKLPVMVWIYGGGYMAGATSEPRQDGGNLCKKGVIVVSMNYRLGIFGFFAHPELTQESTHHASGNYGLMDQIAALEWVRDNIARFGGDPDNVTLFGESAGSFSVSALMASPRAQGLFRRAIGESGAFFSQTLDLASLADAEQADVAFAREHFGTSSLAELRALPADRLLAATLKPSQPRFRPIVDGDVLPEDARAIYSAGHQAHVPLLAGWNRDEGSYHGFFGDQEPTLANYRSQAAARFGGHAPDFLDVYAARSDVEARRAAQDFSGDQFIGFSTWKWLELHRATGGSPVWRYEFDQTLPLPTNAPAGTEPAAPHASEIEFVFGMLPAKDLPWRDTDRRVSDLMSSYWTNFAKYGDPNGPGLPRWPVYQGIGDFPVMHLQADPVAKPDVHRGRYLFLDRTKPAS